MEEKTKLYFLKSIILFSLPDKPTVLNKTYTLNSGFALLPGSFVQSHRKNSRPDCSTIGLELYLKINFKKPTKKNPKQTKTYLGFVTEHSCMFLFTA